MDENQSVAIENDAPVTQETTPEPEEAVVIDLGPTLTEICQDLRNWYVLDTYSGSFSISDGNIITDKLIEGQYFRIMGSIFSDGVHKYPSTDLPSETFTGALWAIAIPARVIKLAQDVHDWRT